MMKKFILVSILLSFTLFVSCNKEIEIVNNEETEEPGDDLGTEDDEETEEPVDESGLATSNLITDVFFRNAAGEILIPLNQEINNEENEVNVNFPFGIDVTNLSVVVAVSKKAELKEEITNAIDFTNDQLFTVVAENGDANEYKVKVASIPMSQRQALISMYTGPSSGDNNDDDYWWDTSEGSDMSDWPGVGLDAAGVNVIRLSFDNDIGGLIKLNENIGYLPYLEVIDDSDAGIGLPETINGTLDNLTGIYLEYSSNTLYPWVGELPNLKYLVSYDSLNTLPDFVYNITSLETITMEYGNLGDIPAAIGNLKNLKVLNLYETGVTSLPSEFSQLNQLERLYISYSSLTSFDFLGTDFPNMKQLYLSGNEELSSVSNIGTFTNLETLRLSDCNLTNIPESIGGLTNLTYLWLNDNNLTTIPSEIGQLSNLKTLTLNSNQLTSVPSEIGQLSNLTILYLYNNQLTSAPVSLGNLTSLQQLYLSTNKLTAIPQELSQLTSLIRLYLTDNPDLTSIPQEVCDLGNQATTTVYKDVTAICE